MNSPNTPRRHVFVFFAVLLFLPSTFVCAQSIVPKKLVIDNANGNVTLGLDLEIQKKKQIEDALENGESLHLVLHASLYKKRFFLWNRTVSRQKMEWQLTSNPVTRQLEIRRGRDATSTRVARQNFWNTLNKQIQNIKIVFADSSQAGFHPEQYFVEFQIQLGRNLPIWVEIVDIFWQDELEQNIGYEMALDN